MIWDCLPHTRKNRHRIIITDRVPTMRLTGYYEKHSAAFETMCTAFFASASRADRQRLAIAFCKGVDTAGGTGIHENPAGQVDDSKRPPPTRPMAAPAPTPSPPSNVRGTTGRFSPKPTTRRRRAGSVEDETEEN